MWIKDKNGLLLVAQSGRKKIAVSHLSVCPAGDSAWFEGVRVHPDYRRSKIATALLGSMIEYATGAGARQASAIVSAENIASQQMMQKAGFEAISRWSYYSTNHRFRKRKTAARPAGKDDLDAVWMYLQQSTTYKKSAGRYVKAWHWYRIDRKTVRSLIKDRRVIVTGQPVKGVMILNPDGYWDRKDVLQIVYLDSHAQDLFSYAVNQYMEGKFDRLHLICQRDVSIKINAIEESEEFILYNKILTP
ncbi:MAG: hypothetical protein DA330_01400 [Nitrososphaera sp.]|nr:hypothetical protein [Nitrososphaera sp.]